MYSNPGARSALVGNQQQRRHGLDAVQIEFETFERVAIALFSLDQLWRFGAVIEWQVAKQAPEQPAALLLIGGEFSDRFEGLRVCH
jgi:hypothetical protein